MHPTLQRIEKFCTNPHIEAIFGILIMATGFIEGWDSIFEDVTTGDLGAHHGVILMGFIHAFKSIPAILGGLALFAHAEERDHDGHA